MKLSHIISAFLFFSSTAFACPQLEGKYNQCESEIRYLGGEYNIEQYMQDKVQYYHVQKIDSENEDQVTEETIRTDNVKTSRKEKLPKYGITVRIETKSRCEGEKVIGVSDGFSMGMKMGTFTTVLSKVDNILHIDIDGTYLNKEVHKRIKCIQY
jgi:RNase P/RNase MRP subunit p29